MINKKPSSPIENKIINNKISSLLILLWFTSGVIGGLLFEGFNIDAPYTSTRYEWMIKYIDNYSRFSWISFFHIIEIPIFLYLIINYGLLEYFIPKRVGFILLSISIISLFTLLDLIEIKLSGAGKLSRIFYFLLENLDWLGASIFLFLICYMFVLSLALLTKCKLTNSKNRFYLI